MQHFGKAALRITKNYTKGYSDTQAKVRDATSNDPWGPSGTQMNEIAQLTYNQNDFIEIMEMLDKRLNDKGKNWRHVFKSLTVLDYCLHQGSENVVIYFRDNIYIVKTLKEFQFIDDDGKDQGANVRQKAKDISNLLVDEARLREERRARASMRDRMIRGAGGDYGAGDELGVPGDENKSRRQPNGGGPPRRKNVDEDDLKRAIEESKKTLAQEQRDAEERELEKAIQLSKDEEEKRKHAVEDSNAAALFDDQNQLPSPSSHSNNPFPLLDPTPYAVGLQPQYTVQQQYTSVQPQFTSFNPYQQQMEQEAAQAEYLRQQQAFQQQQQAQQQQQQQEEWMRQQQMLQMQQQQQQQNLFAQQQLAPQPTGFGSNNPFAPTTSLGSTPAQSPVTQNPPSFNLSGTYDSHSPANLSTLSSPEPSRSPQPYNGGPAKPINVRTKKELGENEAHLADLFANRDDGQDTFGNIGALRFGQTEAGRVLAQRTGATSAASSHNPFAKQPQSTDQPFFNI
ncbi:hypothetical protein Agabi119p4_10113 [Agaricus bisporus var. burnettii]|uniref:ENTH domain-containing protein n=1 Tax=Agaricus bisporus var. burnettii TaxID=192524 RepID=A0A8H7EW38_AGABI|nr:hypothetical protein Agabi119p4_10113 [Agaricus bisporus var. burnettii]